MSVSNVTSNFLEEKEFGDFTAFYIAITICTVLGGSLFILNIVFCCCSKYKEYWQDSDTGNRWIISIWTKTPHKQTPLDYTELEKGFIPPHKAQHVGDPGGYIELQKRESDL